VWDEFVQLDDNEDDVLTTKKNKGKAVWKQEGKKRESYESSRGIKFEGQDR
jgi:hypothetical protein